MKKTNKLTALERDQISIGIASGSSLRQIAKKLSRSVSTISDEIKRNSVKSGYKPSLAQALSRARNLKSRKNNPLKNPKVYSYVVNKLRYGWSPEQIAGRLKRKNKGKTIICHETIYRYIYNSEGRKKELYQYLTRSHRKRRPWYGRCLYRRGIANRVNIRERPEIVNTKTTFGHWETDVVEGRKHRGGIQTLSERKTRYYQAKLLPNIDSEYGVKAQYNMLVKLPKKARKTLTLDNGKENYNHVKLQKTLGIKTYFCDPNCAWQKGSNENLNGVLRRYIPKKTDLAMVSQFELDCIIEEVNNTPRKCLNYQTPREAFQNELKLLKCSDSD